MEYVVLFVLLLFCFNVPLLVWGDLAKAKEGTMPKDKCDYEVDGVCTHPREGGKKPVCKATFKEVYMEDRLEANRDCCPDCLQEGCGGIVCKDLKEVIG